MLKTYGDVRKLIEKDQLSWAPLTRNLDADALPTYSLGGDAAGIPKAKSVKKLAFKTLLGPSLNPQLTVRRVELGMLSAAAAKKALAYSKDIVLPKAAPKLAGAPTGGTPARAAAVDWRRRWGRNWITTVRDQNPCAACWAFAGVALVEAMMSIECAYWARLSEGDIHKGVGSPCANGNNMGTVSDWIRDHGVADPGCFAWTTANVAYTPTPDRDGRSVRAPAFQYIGSIEDQKIWIDSVGPLVTWLNVYQDFSGAGSGVYRRSTSPTNLARGGHFMLVVGYDDALGAWLCKNSWGTGFGANGYVWLAYGDSNVDDYAKCGLRGINPDPWTKRRLHNGNLYESGNGALHRNLEVVGSGPSGVVTPRWREGGAPWTWSAAPGFANDAAVCPTLTGTTYSRNLEIVYSTTGHRLHHWWRAGGGGNWNDGGVFGPADSVGPVGFCQGDYGAPGNFEVVVARSPGLLQHCWRDGAGWHLGAVFGSNVAVGGASLVQGQYGTPHGNLEYVATLRSGCMQHFWRSAADLIWRPGLLFGAGVSSPPVMIQGQFGMADEAGHGNLELCVAVGGHVEHWWRADNGDGQWRRSAIFGSQVAAAAGLCQGSYGMNLELVVLRTDRQLQHYWRDGAGWHAGPVIGPA